MFFNEKEMRVAEDLAWKMLDGWNHAYMPELEDYAYFSKEKYKENTTASLS